jgi:hypothetical protein
MQIMLYKGFTMLTNLRYFRNVPESAVEMVIAIIAHNIKVVVNAYVLGTVFHYLVLKDPEIETTKELMADLDQYCVQRHLPQDLVMKMKEHVTSQQKHAAAVSAKVQQVRCSRFPTFTVQNSCRDSSLPQVWDHLAFTMTWSVHLLQSNIAAQSDRSSDPYFSGTCTGFPPQLIHFDSGYCIRGADFMAVKIPTYCRGGNLDGMTTIS